MAQAAVDIQPPAVADVEFAARVAPVSDGQQRRRKEWRLALATVCVAGEDPATAGREVRRIDAVWVVAERERRLVPVDLGDNGLRCKARPPEVVDAHQLQSRD